MTSVDTRTPRRDSLAAWRVLVAVSIFLSAALLFQVQPLISSYILPWFGGSPAVWNTCMLFFQSMLCGGYLYAHLLTTRLGPRAQVAVHGALLLGACVLLPIVPEAQWKPTGAEDPSLRIVALLGVSVGLPYFLLAATAPLLQRWFSDMHRGGSPYHLYSLSNAGSLLALISYPFVVRPLFSLLEQAVWWSWGFAAFAVGCVLCGLGRLASSTAHAGEFAEHGADRGSLDVLATERPGLEVYAAWFFLPMLASVMLLAMTNQVCLDVASVPFLWVLPLSLYLLSFILCFDRRQWYSRRIFGPGLALGTVGVTYLLYEGAAPSILTQITVYFSALFFCCMVSHGELAILKPDPKYLTSFYLMISAGGAAGGIFVALVATHVFPSYLEIHLSVLACGTLALLVCHREFGPMLERIRWGWLRGAVMFVPFAGFGTMGYFVGENAGESIKVPLEVTRSFYGVLRVDEKDAADPQARRRTLRHGRILHGEQFLAEERRRLPTTYYAEESGVGVAFASHRNGEPRQVGLVGLGVGTLAAYGRTGDRFVFFEINRDVLRLARQHFTYLADCQAEVEFVFGDARLHMELQSPRNFDLLVLDAFSGDAIPTHLLTREAAEVYLKHLKPDGILAVHISNRHFELEPVVAGLAEEFGLAVVQVTNSSDTEQGVSSSDWILLSRDPASLTGEEIQAAGNELQAEPLLWTDDYTSLFRVMK